MIFIRYLHLLAHHPDYALTRELLPDLAKYIDFYLDQIASADTISLLYHLAGRLKSVRDARSHAHSEVGNYSVSCVGVYLLNTWTQNLYTISELAQYIIKLRAQAHNWTLQVIPKKVKLPSDILRPLPTPEAANEVSNTRLHLLCILIIACE